MLIITLQQLNNNLINKQQNQNKGEKMINNMKEDRNKKNKYVRGIIQSYLIFTLIVLIIIMMSQIGNLQGIARVVNYAGLVRGMTQCEIKLEINGNQDDNMIQYLDNILSELQYEGGDYGLVSLKDMDYQKKLEIQSDYWKKLKIEIENVRQNGFENTNIEEMSEKYFNLADETVSAAEDYSERVALIIRRIEILSMINMLMIVLSMISQMLSMMKIQRKNKLLEQKAYIDLHTGLPNKSRCEEVLNNDDVIENPTICMMFDLNNLKVVNDTIGHLVGDQMIMNFARFLRYVIPEKDFVGRYGGDEFMVVIYDANKTGSRKYFRCFESRGRAF